ncbi:MAG: hypothetical protein EBZ67_07420 [Chitinophagia bacterium]|nr:hypothetical protein [Chitinophagia bacterium]
MHSPQRLSAFILFLAISSSVCAQQTDDLLSLVEKDAKQQKEYVKSAFKSSRVINGHSMEFLAPGLMDFRILHRFGLINQGYSNFFGLDQASMRMGFDFGITRNLMLGVGRSTYRKEVDGFVKYAPIQQSVEGGSPVTVALVAGVTLNTLPWANPSIRNYFSSRLAYYYQAIVGRKFNEAFTLQVAPTLVHNNLVPLASQPNDVVALGIGGRYKVTKRIALTWDYHHLFNGIVAGQNTHPLSLGMDIETGGHVFQLHVSNAVGMNERAFVTETTGKWTNGDIRFGFNLSRVFQLGKRKSAEKAW